MEAPRFTDLVFDLDGTLLETLTGINFAINLALRNCGYDYQFTYEETKALVGDGADTCVRRALKEKGNDLQAFSALKAEYMPLYRKHQNDHVVPFPGMVETLRKLQENGVRLFVCTNKPNALAQVVVESHFGKGLFTAIRGHEEGEPVKPDSFILDWLNERFHMNKGKTLFVGDSHVDIDTAKNVGLPVALCLYGYGVYSKENKARSDFLLEKADDLLDIVLGTKKA